MIREKQGLALMVAAMMAVLLTASCAPKQITKGEKFPQMYTEAPACILILPPMNESTAADAKSYYGTTIQECMSYWGYYTLPYEITSDILKMEGIYDTELIKGIPLAKFREYFGADAVLFTTIKKWDVAYIVIASNLTVSIDCELMSTKTDQQLWKYNGTVVVDLSGGHTGGGLAGLIAKAIIAAAQTAMADYVPYAKQANYRSFFSLPFGKYHPQYQTDQSMSFFDQTQQQ
jgi:hypothetical protein